eukprot:TRINITY_DN168_c0_g1_i2.p1 TRINITY_DN168_c0_g1~~TRINITY_DN168_c0_g1_i2.p1  ORF type:complete len:282 (+),score=12.32 TRINITY_DN168_c0_g1_i2:165-1010(+)
MHSSVCFFLLALVRVCVGAGTMIGCSPWAGVIADSSFWYKRTYLAMPYYAFALRCKDEFMSSGGDCPGNGRAWTSPPACVARTTCPGRCYDASFVRCDLACASTQYSFTPAIGILDFALNCDASMLTPRCCACLEGSAVSNEVTCLNPFNPSTQSCAKVSPLYPANCCSVNGMSGGSTDPDSCMEQVSRQLKPTAFLWLEFSFILINFFWIVSFGRWGFVTKDKHGRFHDGLDLPTCLEPCYVRKSTDLWLKPGCSERMYCLVLCCFSHLDTNVKQCVQRL